MQKSQAIQIIKETFESPFNKEQFVYFTKNLFNNIEDAPFIYRGNLIRDAYAPYIRTLERVGKYQDSAGNKIDILIVHLKKETSLERARTMQRNFVAWYLNGSRGGILKDAAVVAFVSPDSQDWRFSLIKMEYKLTESKDGKTKVKQELTPARRWSFLVGENENSHTAKKRLLPVLQDDRNNPLLSQLEDAFNIEVVTKEFFDKYRGLFLRTKEVLDEMVEKDERIKNDFTKKGINTVDFAKKLLGQVVFLYFLQKKGWFGVERDAGWGTGPKNFLRLLFEKETAKSKNFFNDGLELLFYEALAVERTDDFYGKLNCKIPFLNGGLFDPIGKYDWVHTDIFLPNELFSNEIKTKEGDIGTGILDVFDRYNFTVKEDEPLEKEVAVDPEMLGKVFENLLKVKDRKSKGTYYTPREIVHYMCQESLINYLSVCFAQAGLATEPSSSVIASSEGAKQSRSTDVVLGKEKRFNLSTTASETKQSLPTKEDIETLIKYGETVVEHDGRVVNKGRETADYSFKLPQSIRSHAEEIDNALKNVRVCDPACGSGAFLVGMMSEIIRTRNALTHFIEDKKNRTIYNFKRHAIQNCLYGVDIDSGAVEIAKLRLWLSLVVDEVDIKNIKPLPNLDYKIMQGNSLISEFMGVNFDTDLKKNERVSVQTSFVKEEADELIEQFQRKKDEFLNESNVSRKSKLKEEIDDLMIKIFETKLKKQKAGYFSKLKEIEDKYFTLPNKQQRDEIIAQEKQALSKKEGFDLEKFEAQLREFSGKNKIKPFFAWKLYFAEVFSGDNPGFDIVIANPPYVRQEEISNKESLKKGYEVFNSVSDIYTYFYERGLKLLHDRGVLTFITSNKFLRARYGTLLRRYLQTNTTIRSIINFGNQHMFEAITNTLIFIAVKGNDKNNKLNYSDSINESEKIKFMQDDLQDREWTIERSEVISLKNKIEKIGISLKDWDIRINYGIKTGYNEAFVIDKEKRDDIISENSNAAEIIKPIIRGRDIERYYYNNSDLYLINTHNGYKIDKGSKVATVDIKNYPAVKSHLGQYRKKLIERRDKGETIYNLRDCAFIQDFSKEKIIWIELTNKNRFSYSDREDYLLAGAFFMVGESLKYLLAFLNSKLCYFYFSLICNSSGMATIQWKKFALEKVPVMKLSNNEQKPFINLVDKILAITSRKDYEPKGNSELNKKVHEYECQIDQLVYKLYGLTEEEIKIVENKR